MVRITITEWFTYGTENFKCAFVMPPHVNGEQLHYPITILEIILELPQKAALAD